MNIRKLTKKDRTSLAILLSIYTYIKELELSVSQDLQSTTQPTLSRPTSGVALGLYSIMPNSFTEALVKQSMDFQAQNVAAIANLVGLIVAGICVCALLCQKETSARQEKSSKEGKFPRQVKSSKENSSKEEKLPKREKFPRQGLSVFKNGSEEEQLNDQHPGKSKKYLKN